jgi:hypothetical protein
MEPSQIFLGNASILSKTRWLRGEMEQDKPSEGLLNLVKEV